MPSNKEIIFPLPIVIVRIMETWRLKASMELRILCILGFTVYIIGLSGDVFIDASKYAAISRYVAETGDLFHMRIMEEPYLQKPPLHFWLSGLSFRILGFSNFAYKLPGFLFFLVGLYSIYRLGKLYYDVTTARIAAFILGFSQAMFLYNNDMHTDTLLTALVTFSIWQLAAYIERGKRMNYILGFLAAGLGLITKGPVGILVPGFAILGHLVVKRDWILLFHPKWIPGIVLVGLILLPVLKGQYDMFGSEAVRFFFWTNNAGRISGSYAGNNRDYFFYLHTLLYLFLPWSVMTFMAFYREFFFVLKRRFRISDSPEGLTWSGILIFIGILSFARMKGPHYMLPVLPLIALVTAKWMVWFEKDPKYRKWMAFMVQSQIVISILLLTVALLIPSVFSPSRNILVWSFLACSVAFFGYLLLSYRNNRLERVLLISGIAVTALNLSINAVFLPELNHFNSGARVSERYNQLAPEGHVLYLYKYSSHEPAFYAKGRVLYLKEERKREMLSTGGWLFTTPTGMDTLQNMNIAFQMVDTFPRLSMSRIHARYLLPESRRETAKSDYLLRINPSMP